MLRRIPLAYPPVGTAVTAPLSAKAVVNEVKRILTGGYLY